MKTGLITILLSIGLVAPISTLFGSTSNDRCLTSESLSKTRPDLNGKPVKVTIAFYVVDIENINDVEQNFNVDFFAGVRWHDPRLVNKDLPDGETCQYHLDDIWSPQLTILNQRAITTDLRQMMIVNNKGMVRYLQRVHGTLRIPMDLQYFPFDKQKIPIQILSLQHPKEHVMLAVDENRIGIAPEFSVPNWVINDLQYDVREYTAKSVHANHPIAVLPIVEFYFHAERHLHYYFWKVIVPTLFIVLMSWALFWIKPIRIETRAGLAATTILTLIAFLFSLSSILPRVSYLTIMDIWVLVCIIYVFAAFVETIISSTIALNGNEQKAEKVQRVARYLFPIIYVSVLAGFVSLMVLLS